MKDDHEDYFLDGEDDAPATQQPQAVSNRTISFQESDAPKTAGQPEVAKPAKRRHRGRRFLAWFITICVAVLGVTFYIRYFNPYTVDARSTGYISSIEKRGIVFKTYEGEMISQSALADTSRVYVRDFTFSIPSDSLAARMQSYQAAGRKVTVIYQRYFGVLPWRGASKCVATGVIPAE